MSAVYSPDKIEIVIPIHQDRETEAQSSHPIQLAQDGAGVQTQIFLAPRLSLLLCLACLL